MFVLSDRVKQSSISEGLGDVVFHSSFPSFQTFAEAYLDVWSWASNLGATRDSPIVCVAVFGD